MSAQRQNSKDVRRLGSSTLEFAALLPIFVVCALLIVESQEMMLRAMCNSHAAFSAARRWLVAGVVDKSYIGEHYTDTGMRGTCESIVNRSGYSPESMRVTLRDSYTLLMPVRGDNGRLALKPRDFKELVVTEQVSGTVSSKNRVDWSDNEL